MHDEIAEILACFGTFNRQQTGEDIMNADADSNKNGLFVISHLMKELKKIVSESQFWNSIYYQNKNFKNRVNTKLEKLEEQRISKIKIFKILLEALGMNDNDETKVMKFIDEKIENLSSENQSSRTNQKRKRKIKINEDELTQSEKRFLFAAEQIAKDKKNVKVAESDFLTSVGKNGQGLYAKKSFTKGEIICGYFGKMVPTADIEKNEYKSDYLIELGLDENGVHMSVDSADSDIDVSGYGKFVNDPIFENAINSYILVQAHADGNEYIYMVATKGIKNGDEILCNYGVGYWEAEQFLKLSPPLQAEINRQRVKKKLPILQAAVVSSSSSQAPNIPVSVKTATRFFTNNAGQLVMDLVSDSED